MSAARPVSADQVASWGVVGAGGAGFPTHVKLKARAETIILNAAECEPLLHKDKEILKAHAGHVLDGLQEAARLVGAKQAIIGIKGKYREVIEMLSSRLPAGMRIQELTDSYPAGDEFVLVYDVLGRIVPPGKIPLAVGAVVINVETAYNIARRGPVTEKFLTVAGAVQEPVTIRVPTGVTIGEAVQLAGGSTVADPAVLIGGVMMGQLAPGLDEPVTKTMGGLIALDQDHVLIRRYRQDWPAIRRIGASACDQCVFCTELCPRFLLGHPIEPHKAMRSLGFTLIGEPNVIGTLFCCECNLCTMMACPEDLDPKNVCTTNKRRLMEQGREWEVEAIGTRPQMHLNNRRVPIQRLINKLGLSRFRNEGPLVKDGYQPSRVVLPLKQHAGAPAVPAVTAGQRVNVGELIAAPAEGKLGAVIHASIAGRVASVSDNVVIEG